MNKSIQIFSFFGKNPTPFYEKNMLIFNGNNLFVFFLYFSQNLHEF